MKRFHFRLEKLLEVRQYHERLAEMKLGAAAGKCALLERRLVENAQASRDASRERFARDRDLFDMQTVELYARRLVLERERTLKALAAAELEKEEARQGYIQASRDKKLIEKVRERRETEYYRAASREETKVLDDLARTGKPYGSET